MQMLLQNLLTELQQRCVAVKDLLSNGAYPIPVGAYVLTLYRQVEQLRRDVDVLLHDPALGSAPLLARQFQVYKRLAEEFQAIEAYPLPVVQRFNAADEQMTALCALLLKQSNVLLIPPPLVATFSTNYYWTTPSFNLIFATALEPSSFLGLPDLYHEVAHFLIELHLPLFAAQFFQELEDYVLQEKRRAVMQQRPGDTVPYDLMLAQWRDYWVIEFIADTVATYLVGESYAWQNLRLCSRTSETVYVPVLGQQSTHPADNARMMAITEMLDVMGESQAALTARSKWQDYVTVLGDAPASPGDYAVCYPDVLMKSLVNYVRIACEQLGLRKANDPHSLQDKIVLTEMINEAWRHFLAESATYVVWEQQKMADLRQVLQSP
jgi:hypothetical protein